MESALNALLSGGSIVYKVKADDAPQWTTHAGSLVRRDEKYYVVFDRNVDPMPGVTPGNTDEVEIPAPGFNYKELASIPDYMQDQTKEEMALLHQTVQLLGTELTRLKDEREKEKAAATDAKDSSGSGEKKDKKDDKKEDQRKRDDESSQVQCMIPPMRPENVQAWVPHIKADCRGLLRDLRVEFGQSKQLELLSDWVLAANEQIQQTSKLLPALTKLGNSLLKELWVKDAWTSDRIPRAQLENALMGCGQEKAESGQSSSATALERALAKLRDTRQAIFTGAQRLMLKGEVETGIRMLMMWKGALRFGDTKELTVGGVSVVQSAGEERLVLDLVRSKTIKGACREERYAVLAGEKVEVLIKWVKEKQETEQKECFLFRESEATWLKKVKDLGGELKDISLHSIRRGALQWLASLAQHGVLNPADIPRIARHSHNATMPPVTWRYLQEVAPQVAVSLSPECAKLL